MISIFMSNVDFVFLAYLCVIRVKSTLLVLVEVFMKAQQDIKYAMRELGLEFVRVTDDAKMVVI